jgi:hypothetical protein
VKGAAWAGSLLKVRWLHEEHNCPLHRSLDMWAGMGGSIEVLAYLKQHGIAFTGEAMLYASQYNRQQAVRYLRSEGVPSSDGRFYIAALRGPY